MKSNGYFHKRAGVGRRALMSLLTSPGWSGYTWTGSGCLGTGQSGAAGRLNHYIGQAHPDRLRRDPAAAGRATSGLTAAHWHVSPDGGRP